VTLSELEKTRLNEMAGNSQFQIRLIGIERPDLWIIDGTLEYPALLLSAPRPLHCMLSLFMRHLDASSRDAYFRWLISDALFRTDTRISLIFVCGLFPCRCIYLHGEASFHRINHFILDSSIYFFCSRHFITYAVDLWTVVWNPVLRIDTVDRKYKVVCRYWPSSASS
jgi:hypothetical protein